VAVFLNLEEISRFTLIM